MMLTKTVWRYIDGRDQSVMRRVHGWKPPRWFRLWMIWATKLGNGLLWYVLGLTLLIFGGTQGLHAIAIAGAPALVSIVLFSKIKKLSHRRRPCQIEPHCWSIITPPDQFSFPSGHAMTSFAIAVALGHVYPGFEYWLLFIALSIAVSRIVLGMHFLTDVIVGAISGASLGMLAVRLFP